MCFCVYAYLNALVFSLHLQNEMTLAKAFEKARTDKKKLQEELNRSQTELRKLREKLAEIEAQLQATRHE